LSCSLEFETKSKSRILTTNRLGWLSSVRFKYKPGYRSCDLLKNQVLSLVENLFFQKNPLQDFLSSLKAVISTNESNRFITGHMIYNLAYT
jgi:hypothetical protein